MGVAANSITVASPIAGSGYRQAKEGELSGLLFLSEKIEEKNGPNPHL